MGQRDAAGLRNDPPIALQTMGDSFPVRKELRAVRLCVLHTGVAVRLLVGARRGGRECEANETEKHQGTKLCGQDQPPFLR